MSRSPRRDQIIVIGGGLLLVVFVILSWVPQSCPVMRRVLIGCPTTPLAHQTPEQQEINRVPHQEITVPSFQVDAKGEEGRSKARIVFEYLAPAGTKAELSINSAGKQIPLATIANPLIPPADWLLSTNQQPDISLYTLEPNTFPSTEDFIAGKPQGLVADEVAARLYKLPAGSFTPLSSVTSLTGYSSLLVSYLPQEPDGTWKWFTQQFDLSDFPLDSQGHFTFTVTVARPLDSAPLLLGELHIDYRK